MDDVLDNICPVYNCRSHYRHICMLASLLLWTEDSLCSLVAVAVHKRLQRVVQEICSSHAFLQRKGHWWLHLPSEGQKLWHAGALWEERAQCGSHSRSHGSYKGPGRALGQAKEFQYARPLHPPGGPCYYHLWPRTPHRHSAAPEQNHDAEQVREPQSLLLECWDLWPDPGALLPPMTAFEDVLLMTPTAFAASPTVNGLNAQMTQTGFGTK